MTDIPFTPRNVAKFAVKAAVAGVIAKKTAEAIDDHTRFDDDDLIVDIGSSVVGWYVSDRLKPYTDKAVDKTADFINAKRAERKEKKDKKSE